MIAVSNFHSALSEKTYLLHKIAERSGFNKVLFERKATRDTYGKYLLHKYHIYNAIESTMERLINNDLLSKFLFRLF